MPIRVRTKFVDHMAKNMGVDEDEEDARYRNPPKFFGIEEPPKEKESPMDESSSKDEIESVYYAACDDCPFWKPEDTRGNANEAAWRHEEQTGHFTYANEVEDEELAQDLAGSNAGSELNGRIPEKQVNGDKVRVRTHDGRPALKIGDETVMLRMTVKTDCQHCGQSEMIDYVVDARTQAAQDLGMGSWWDVTRDDRGEDEDNPYPWIRIQPEVVEEP